MEYVGDELPLFQDATVWKEYFSSMLRPFVRGDVLEVGAGIGGTTPYLHTPEATSWVCLEPDPSHCEKMNSCCLNGNNAPLAKIICGTLDSLPPEQRFHTILYIDVLEHVKDDKAEVSLALNRLHAGGHLVTISPAHNFLFNPFDKAVGHFRRYNKGMLSALTPQGATLARLTYLDSLGMLLSLANKFILKSSTPKRSQVQFWDKRVVPLSKVFDPITGYNIGKNIIAIWKKQD